MEKLPLINVVTGESEWVNVDDILFGHIRNEKLIFNTNKGVYQPITTIRDFLPLLEPLGFKQLEKSNVVNIRKITRYDKRLHSVFFEGINSNGGMLVSRRNRKKVKDFLNE